MIALVLALPLVLGAPPRDPVAAQSAEVLRGGEPRSRALVVALHGGSWSGRTPQQLAERLRAELDSEARNADLALVVPVAPAGGAGEEWQVPWLTAQGEALVLRVILEAVETGRVDARRVHLAGHGAGATGALHLAARHPELIAGVAAWSGTPSPLWDDQGRVVGLAGDPAAGLGDVGVYLWSGDDDEHLDRAALDLFTADLRRLRAKAGRPLLIECGPGGHGYGEGPRAGLRFLKEQRKTTRR